MSFRPTRSLLVSALILSLPACGGGGGATPVATTTVPAPEPVASETRVVIEPSTPEALQEMCDRKGATILSPCEGTAYCLVEIPPASTVPDFLKDIEDEDCVRDAAADSAFELPEGEGSRIPAFVEEDPGTMSIQAAFVRIGVVAAQARGFDGEGQVVAVIDTGIDIQNPALAGHLLPGWDAIDADDDPTDHGNGRDDNGNGLVDEGVGHGTFVASLIAAVAPRAKILPIRALDSDSVGTASTVTRAFAMAVSRGAKIINFSGGLGRKVRMIEQAVEAARSSGATVIAAAGNRSLSELDYPAQLRNVVAVTSVDMSDRKSDFASWGDEVDFCAPGEDILGVHPRSPTGMARWSGTSFSTALVTGCFALVRSGRGHTLPPTPLFMRFESTAVSVDALNPDYKDRLGHRVDVDAAATDD